MAKQKSLKLGASRKPDGPVECLGQTFENEAARRAHFTELLRQKLQEPGFRETPGFPKASDEDILRLSDPPYYTACPNPFLSLWLKSSEPLDDRPDSEDGRVQPFQADIQEGKNDAIYTAHSYHTKVPHRAILRYILHYTKPGDVILDAFCGSGQTGIAAVACGRPDKKLPPLSDRGMGSGGAPLPEVVPLPVELNAAQAGECS
jgi:hypothetical protein